MRRQLSSLLLAILLSATPVLGQSLMRQMAGTPSSKATPAKKGGIRVAPGSLRSVNPSQVFNYLKGQPGTSRRQASPQHINAQANVGDSLLLYGLNIQNGDYRTPSPLPTQVFSFHAAPTFSYTRESNINIENPLAGFYAKGKFYALYSSMDYDEDWNTLTTARVDVYDATSWQLLTSKVVADGDLGMNFYFRQAGVYDPVSDKAYCIGWGNYGVTDKPLIEVNLETLDFKVIGATEHFFQTLFVSKEGDLYGLDVNDEKIYQIDKATAACTEIGQQDTGFDTNADVMSSATDPVTGTVYWAMVDNGGGSSYASALYTINLKTAHCEKICDMPGNEHFMGLYIPYVVAEAPRAASKIDYKDGKLCFTVPTTTYTSGQNLGDDLKAVVTVDGTVSESPVAAGQQVELPLELQSGNHIITVAIANAAGTGAVRRFNTFVGQDVPTAVGNLTARADDGKNVVLTWNKPEGSVFGGFVSDDAINYRIVRYPDEVVVVDNLKETTYTDVLPERRARYYYVVTAKNGDDLGKSAQTEAISGGSVYYPPFTESFDSQDDFDSFTVIDANNDQHTWTFMNTVAGDCYAYLVGNGTTDPESGFVSTNNDDYLISLPIALEAGVDYRLSFDNLNQWMTHEYMRLLLGTDVAPSDADQLIAVADIQENSSYSYIFHVAKSGLYRLKMHSNTIGNSVNVSIDNICIETYASFEGPAAVANLTATAGDKGALTNTISFTAPTTNYQGGTLSAISRIDIFRDGALKAVHTFDAPATGAQLSWTDENVDNGSHTYRVVAFNDKGQGEESLITNWVGLDVPGAIPNVKYRMNANNQAEVTWDIVGSKGMHGGYVDPSDVKYVLCRYNEWDFSNHWPEVTSLTSGQTLTDDSYMGFEQEYVKYMLVAENGAGRSVGEQFGIVLGTPYAMPYAESFDFYGYPMVSQNPWTLLTNSYYYAWEVTDGAGQSVKPADGDAGMLQFTYIDSDSNPQVMTAPRVALANSTTPELTFYMYHGFEAEPEDLELNVLLNYDDEGWTKAQTIAYNNGATGWARHSVLLRKDASNVQFAFQATAADASASVYVDAIKIAEGVPCDIALEGIALNQKRIAAGEKAVVKVGISNYGIEVASDFTVELKRDGAVVATQNVEALANGQSLIVGFDVPTTKHDASKIYSFSAEVKSNADANAANNMSRDVKLFVKGSDLPVAQNLNGTTSADKVNLTWNAPATDEKTDAVVEDFDSYESFIINNIGDWTTYDGDGTSTVYFGGPEIPNAFEPKAWQIWAPVEAGFSLEKFPVIAPHSGDKVLASWAASDGVEKTLECDDWLISSEITGGSDLSFWYRVPNAGSDPQVFEIMYSTTDKSPENFMVFDRDSLSGTTEWVNFEYSLPADAKFFAIRNCSYGSYTVAFLDDVKYTPLYGSTSKLTLKGYNVYRDDQLIAEKVSGTAFTDNTADGQSHVYAVSAVWAEGESNLSNDYNSDAQTNAITTATAASSATKAWNIAGQQVGKTHRGIRIVRMGDKVRKVVK